MPHNEQNDGRRMGATLYAFQEAFSSRLIMEWYLWLEVVNSLLRRRRPSQVLSEALGPGLRFSIHKGAVSSIIVPITVIASCVDVPLIHLLVISHVPFWLRGAIHVGLLAANAWALVWIIGDRSAIVHIPHVVDATVLRLRVGFRLALDVPLSAIRGVYAVKGSPRERMPARGLNRNDVTLVTPMEEPNILVEVDSACKAVRDLRAGRSVSSPRFLAIRVDDPDGFRRAITTVQ